jgi:hypothetical protein
MPPLLFTLFFCCVYSGDQAQTKVALSLTLKPGYLYREIFAQKLMTTFNLDSCSQEMKDAMRDAGFVSNVPKTTQTLMESEMHCGKPQDDGMMRVRKRITRNTDSATAKALPVGTTFYGKAKNGGLPLFDSIDAQVPTGQKEIILSTIQKISTQIFLPDTVLSLGESYTQTMPVDIPIGGMNMKMIITQTYTLRGFSADTAGFDIKMKATIDVAGAPLPLTGGGGGVGHMTYDRKNNFTSDLKMDGTISMAIQQGDLNMKLAVNTIQSWHCIIGRE